MTRAMGAAVQLGEFGVGVVAAYVAVGAAWALTSTLWLPLLVATLLVAAAVGVELRFGERVLGLVAGVLPAAVVTAGALVALTTVLSKLAA